MKKYIVLVSLITMLAMLAGCAPTGRTVESDSAYSYGSIIETARLPVDDAIYTLTGMIAGSISSLSRQTAPGYTAQVQDGVTTYTPPVIDGKSFVRLQVTESDWTGARPETIVLLKSTDTKTTALLPGDIVTFRCRLQAEAVAPSYKGQAYDATLSTTWELDYCRLLSPVIETQPSSLRIPDINEINQVQP